MVKVLVAGVDKDFGVLRQPHASAVCFKLHGTIVEGLMLEVELCLGNRFHEIGFQVDDLEVFRVNPCGSLQKDGKDLASHSDDTHSCWSVLSLLEMNEPS